MNANAKELMVSSESPQAMVISRSPEEVLQEAKKAAMALKDVIVNKARPVKFNGEQYLEFEDWQTVGHFYGIKVKTGDAVPVEVDGIKGAKAHADLLDIKSKEIIGGADAYCMRDEQNWVKKPWFQLASMAQTRAGAKALRNALSWVVVLAGYRPTPAEEMEGVSHDRPAARPATSSVIGAKADDSPSPESNGVLSLSCFVRKVTKPGKTKEGKRFPGQIESTDGHFLKSWDEAVIAKAEEAANTKSTLWVEYKKSQYGLEVVKASIPSDIKKDPLDAVLVESEAEVR